MSESIILLVLGAVWVAYLGWYWRENRRTTTDRGDAIRSFASGLGSLGGSTRRGAMPSPVLPPALAPRNAEAAARRRRDVLVSLLMVCVITLFAAIALGPVALALHILADIALAAYGVAVWQRRNAAAEREIKVTMLYPEQRREVATVRRAAHG